MDVAISKLNRGEWIHIFPEGSRSRDGGKTIGSIKKGIGRWELLLVGGASSLEHAFPSATRFENKNILMLCENYCWREVQPLLSKLVIYQPDLRMKTFICCFLSKQSLIEHQWPGSRLSWRSLSEEIYYLHIFISIWWCFGLKRKLCCLVHSFPCRLLENPLLCCYLHHFHLNYG